MGTATRNIDMMRGDTFTAEIVLKNITADTVKNLTLSVKKTKQAEEYTLQASLTGGQITAAEPDEEGDSKYQLRLAPEMTNDLEPGAYKYDLELRIGEDVYTLVEGNFTIKRDVTR